jgi:hypothetical protein
MDSKKNKEAQKPKFYYSVTPDALMDDKDVPREARHFWSEIYRWCKNKKSNHPRTTRPLDFFAEWIGVSKRSVQRWKAILMKSGWLKEIPRPNNTSLIILNKIKEIPEKGQK